MNYLTGLEIPWGSLVNLFISQLFCPRSPLHRKEHNTFSTQVTVAEGSSLKGSNCEPWVILIAATVLGRNRFNCSEYQLQLWHHPSGCLKPFHSPIYIYQWLSTDFNVNSKLHIITPLFSLSIYQYWNAIHMNLFVIFNCHLLPAFVYFWGSWLHLQNTVFYHPFT